MSYDVWGIARSVVEFKCPLCAKLRTVKLKSRKSRWVVALSAAILLGAFGTWAASWAGNAAFEVLLVGALSAIAGWASFYTRILRPPIR